MARKLRTSALLIFVAAVVGAVIYSRIVAYSLAPTMKPADFQGLPIWEIPIELRRLIPGLPVLVDPSHISGNRSMLPQATWAFASEKPKNIPARVRIATAVNLFI